MVLHSRDELLPHDVVRVALGFLSVVLGFYYIPCFLICIGIMQFVCVVADIDPGFLAGASLALASSSLLSLQSLTARVDGELVMRLEANTVVATAHIIGDVSTAIDAVQRCVPESVRSVRRRLKLTDKLLEMREREVHAGLKTLALFLQYIGAGDDALELTEDALAATVRLSEDITPATNVSIALDPSGAQPSVATSSRIVSGIDSTRSDVCHPAWLVPNRESLMTITVVDSAREPVFGVTPADVVVGFDEEPLGWFVSSVTVTANVISLLIAPAAECTPKATLRADVGSSPFTIPLEVRRAHRTRCVDASTLPLTRNRTP